MVELSKARSLTERNGPPTAGKRIELAFWNFSISLLDRARRPTLSSARIVRIWLSFAFCALAGLVGGIALFVVLGR